MTAVLALLSEAWPILLAVGGILFGWMRHKQAQTTKAEAARQVAEAEKRAAQNDAALAQSNQAGAQAGADNAKVRRDEDADAAAIPGGDATRVLRDEWGK